MPEPAEEPVESWATMVRTRNWWMRPGHIVRSTKDRQGREERGVVVAGPLQRGRPVPYVLAQGPSAVGCVAIEHSPGIHTITNFHGEWTQVPAGETTAAERVLAALVSWQPPDWLDPGDDPQDMDSMPYALIRALLPPAVLDEVDNDDSRPHDIPAMTLAVAAWLDDRSR